MYLLDSSAPEPTTAPDTAPDSNVGALLRALARTPALVDRTGHLAAEVAAALAGTSTLDPVKGDKRFADPAWSSHPVYRRICQAYLVVERAINEAVESADVDWQTRERARFAAGILASALAPTNAPGDHAMPGSPSGPAAGCAWASTSPGWRRPSCWRCWPATGASIRPVRFVPSPASRCVRFRFA